MFRKMVYGMTLVACISVAQAQTLEDIDQQYRECLESSQSESEKGRCALARALSIETGLKDYGQALSAYNEIAQQYRSLPEIAAEALLKHGNLSNTIYRYEQAKASFNQIVSLYPQSDQVLFAYSGLASAEAGLLNPTGIEAVLETVKERYPADPVVLRVLLIDADFAMATSGDTSRATKRYTELIERAPASRGASTARLRLADILYPHRSFEKAIEDYHSILRDFPAMSVEGQAWAWAQTGIYHYQLDQLDQAAEAFAQVSRLLPDAPPTHARIKQVNQYTTAMQNPETVEGLLCLYDKAVRWRQAGYRDYAWDQFREFVARTEQRGGAFEKYCNDQSIPVGERAQMRYRKAFALFEAVDHHRSLDALEQTQAELAKSPNPENDYTYLENVTSQQCQFFEAYHHIHHGHYCHSIPLFRSLLDNPNRVAELVPKCYKEIILCYLKEKDPLGAALAAEEFLILYPYRVEAQYYSSQRKRILDDHPQIASDFTVQRDSMIARLGEKPQSIDTALEKIEQEVKELAQNEGGEGK